MHGTTWVTRKTCFSKIRETFQELLITAITLSENTQNCNLSLKMRHHCRYERLLYNSEHVNPSQPHGYTIFCLSLYAGRNPNMRGCCPILSKVLVTVGQHWMGCQLLRILLTNRHRFLVRWEGTQTVRCNNRTSRAQGSCRISTPSLFVCC